MEQLPYSTLVPGEVAHNFFIESVSEYAVRTTLKMSNIMHTKYIYRSCTNSSAENGRLR